jgi:hypothetical protein
VYFASNLLAHDGSASMTVAAIAHRVVGVVMTCVAMSRFVLPDNAGGHWDKAASTVYSTVAFGHVFKML